MLERWALRYLSRRGWIILPMTFTGVVLGHCLALRDGDDMFISPLGDEKMNLIVVNHSVVQDQYQS